MAKQREIPVPQRKGLRWFALILVLVCELMAYTWIRTESTQAMLRISQAQAQIQKLISYGKALGLERDRLSSDARITRIALTRLGLTSDVSARTVYLPDTLGTLNLRGNNQLKTNRTVPMEKMSMEKN